MRDSIWPAVAMAIVLSFCASISRAQNPLSGPDATPRPFVGSFTGENISLELTRDADQDTYTGWLTFKGNRYPCSGAIENSQFAGQFLVDQHDYTFSAGITGDGLMLNSGGKNYALKRDAAPAAGGGQAGDPAAQPMTPVVGWMKPGVRLTYWGSAAVIPGTGTTLVPDDNGNWKTPDGQTFSAADNPGGGGMGYQQLTVSNIVNGNAIVDYRNFGLNPQTQSCTSISATGYVLPVNNGGDFWTDPRQLAQMQTGNNGPVHTFRGPYKLGNKMYDAVRITTRVDGGYTQTTFDVASGIALSIGSCTTGAGQMAPGPNGQGMMADGNTHVMQGFFAGMRQTNLPWTGQRGTPDLAQLRQMDFAGSYVTAVQMAGTVNWGYSSHWDILKIDDYSIQLRMATTIDYRNGQPPQPQTMERGGSLAATIWVDPRILAKLQQGQMIDEDPFTKMKSSVADMQNGTVVFAEQGATENSAAAFDLRTGLLSAMQLQQRNGPGLTTISLQRTR